MLATRLNCVYRLTGTKLSALYLLVTSSLLMNAPGGRRLQISWSITRRQEVYAHSMSMHRFEAARC